MDLVELTQKIEERYQRYLKTTFYFRDPVLRASFEEALRDTGRLSKGPYLEATPVFKREKSPHSLFENLLGYAADDGFLNAMERGRPLLYRHQEEAVRLVFNGHNVVVATGTGSGKTESFLYPVFLHLYQEFRQGKLGPGVRALILYPMNALANDQRERLGEICKLLKENRSPFYFTFGQYTGDTPNDENDSYRNARSRMAAAYEGEMVLRKDMRQQPPHILLTNYSMLEYLLLRPEDSELFDKGRARWWKYLILDEAHQYRGSKGIEMAMLLRRLKQRLREGGQLGDFRCIATSASIAGSNEDCENVAKFAEALFDEKFYRKDVILGETEPLPAGTPKSLPPNAYPTFRKTIEVAPTGEILTMLSQLAMDLQVALPAGEDISKKLGQVLQLDNRAVQLRRHISGTSAEVQAIADQTFSDLPSHTRVSVLSKLVELLQEASDPVSGSPLLSARYHLFLRSLEGAFVAYWPEKKIYLDRQAATQEGFAFEIALCRECGQHYFVGKVKDGKLREAIRDPGHPDFGADFFRPIDILDIENDDIDTKQTWQLCTRCGEIWPAKLGLNGGICTHGSSILVVTQDAAGEKEDQIPKCTACGYRAPDPVREVVHGTDGPHAVIATTLHQSLPTDRKKVLAFADGRQEAAFFAWYLEKSYQDIRNRNLILKAARNLTPHTAEGLSLRELATGIRDLFRSLHVFEGSTGDIELRREAWLAIYREFLTDEPRISLDGVGLLRWSIKWPHGLRIPDVLISPKWLLSESEAKALITILFGLMRRERAVELRSEDAVSIGNDNWEELNLQARQVSVQLIKTRGGRAMNSWAGETTARADLLKRILRVNGLEDHEAKELADNTLRAIWEVVRQWDNEHSSDGRILIRIGDAYRLNPDWWRAFPIGKNDSLFQCDTCGRLSWISIKAVCPRHKCPGKLKAIQQADLEQNHYRLLYDEDLPGRLIVEEHTAQIEKEKAREFQNDFKQNKIDVLSCSTTFELGVDLGDLDTVFLRNVPPEAFNYAQRVGRSGRRKGHPGLAITYCKRGPHDLYHYADPQRILRGTTRPPTLSLSNEKIILRHIVAATISHFFSAFPFRFENVAALLTDMEHPSGVSDFKQFLLTNREVLEASLCTIVPSGKMARIIGLGDGTWIEKIAGDQSRFALAEAELSSDYKTVRSVRQRAFDEGDDDMVKWAGTRARTIAEEDGLSFLSRKAIIPKYGFPVDVVALDTQPTISKTSRSRDSLDVTLQRDLAIAIAEFAPTSKLIADKKEWESKGLKKVAGKEWPQMFYRRCTRHNFFKRWGKEQVEPPGLCGCDQLPITLEYIDPIFGFVTAKGRPEEPKRRPARTFTTRPYFVGFSGPEPNEKLVGNIQLTKTSPGNMVVLCEGRREEGFYICHTCGVGFRRLTKDLLKGHKTLLGSNCSGKIENVSLGHEFPTDVLRLQFLAPMPTTDTEPVWFAYALAYAIVEGAAEILEVPSSDLNSTVSYSTEHIIPPIILYDNVPGGAGLVARLEEDDVLRKTLEAALIRVSGACNCGEETSCYGCLRSYRNQFAHQHLKRGPVNRYLRALLTNW